MYGPNVTIPVFGTVGFGEITGGCSAAGINTLFKTWITPFEPVFES